MDGMNDIEKAKKEEEIKDIVSERKEIQKLMRDSQWEKLDTYLKQLNIKYRAETIIYNIANPVKPRNVIENAQNCIKFLDSLLKEKKIDVVNRARLETKKLIKR